MASIKKSKSKKRRAQRAGAAARLLAATTKALHAAVKQCDGLDAIKAILGENTAAVKECDESGHLALHYACSRGASLEVIQFLAEEYPEVLAAANKFKALPLHYACDRGASFKVLFYLVEQYPKALEEKGFFGNLPVHLIVARTVRLEDENHNVEKMMYIVEEFTRGLAIPNDDDLLPLHHGWSSLGSRGIRWMHQVLCVTHLARAYPKALFYTFRYTDYQYTSLLHYELACYAHSARDSFLGLRILSFFLLPSRHALKARCEHCSRTKAIPF